MGRKGGEVSRGGGAYRAWGQQQTGAAQRQGWQRRFRRSGPQQAHGRQRALRTFAPASIARGLPSPSCRMVTREATVAGSVSRMRLEVRGWSAGVWMVCGGCMEGGWMGCGARGVVFLPICRCRLLVPAASPLHPPPATSSLGSRQQAAGGRRQAAAPALLLFQPCRHGQHPVPHPPWQAAGGRRPAAKQAKEAELTLRPPPHPWRAAPGPGFQARSSSPPRCCSGGQSKAQEGGQGLAWLVGWWPQARGSCSCPSCTVGGGAVLPRRAALCRRRAHRSSRLMDS